MNVVITCINHLKHAFAFFKRVFFILVSSYILSGSLPAYAAQPGLLSPSELVKELQSGGLILYIRHAATDHSQQDKDLSDLGKCELQRNLSQQGKDESKVMGAVIKDLKIKIGEVYTSPYCRCVDTAKIAFGRYNIVNEMRATFATNLKESTILVSFLKKQLSAPPAKGFNTVLLGHTANLRELTRVWPKPEGVAHIFRPDNNGGYQHLGRILPTEWSTLVGKK